MKRVLTTLAMSAVLGALILFGASLVRADTFPVGIKTQTGAVPDLAPLWRLFYANLADATALVNPTSLTNFDVYATIPASGVLNPNVKFRLEAGGNFTCVAGEQVQLAIFLDGTEDRKTGPCQRRDPVRRDGERHPRLVDGLRVRAAHGRIVRQLLRDDLDERDGGRHERQHADVQRHQHAGGEPPVRQLDGRPGRSRPGQVRRVPLEQQLPARAVPPVRHRKIIVDPGRAVVVSCLHRRELLSR